MPAVVAQVAQLVEQGIENPRVGGSIPSLGTTEYIKKPRPCAGASCFVASTDHPPLPGRCARLA